MAVPQFADTPTQRPRPDRSIATFINGSDAVLSKPVGLRVRISRERTVPGAQMSQSTSLSSEPQIVSAACDRINHVLSESGNLDSSGTSFLESSQTTFDGRKPNVFIRRSMQWPHTLRFQTGNRVGDKGAVAEAFKTSRTTNPYISLAIFEQGSHGWCMSDE